jgi:uncharacterized membrane protein
MARDTPGWGTISAALRLGTIVAVVAIGLGLAWAIAAGAPALPDRSVPELIGDGGPDAIIAVGLLALTLVPIVAIAAAASVFWRAGERRALAVTIVVLALLLFSLAASAFLGASG